jgi:hypothetical protein
MMKMNFLLSTCGMESKFEILLITCVKSNLIGWKKQLQKIGISGLNFETHFAKELVKNT